MEETYILHIHVAVESSDPKHTMPFGKYRKEDFLGLEHFSLTILNTTHCVHKITKAIASKINK